MFAEIVAPPPGGAGFGRTGKPAFGAGVEQERSGAWGGHPRTRRFAFLCAAVLVFAVRVRSSKTIPSSSGNSSCEKSAKAFLYCCKTESRRRICSSSRRPRCKASPTMALRVRFLCAAKRAAKSKLSAGRVRVVRREGPRFKTVLSVASLCICSPPPRRSRSARPRPAIAGPAPGPPARARMRRTLRSPPR